jgi:hypothetical protein
MTADRPQDAGWISTALDAYAAAMQDGDKEAGREARWAIAARLSVLEAENASLTKETATLRQLNEYQVQFGDEMKAENETLRKDRDDARSAFAGLQRVLAIADRAAVVSPPAGSPPNE